MSDVYDIWLYPLQDWWRTVNEMSDFMSTRQMGNFIFRPVKGTHTHDRVATKLCVGRKELDLSSGERERKIHRNSAGD